MSKQKRTENMKECLLNNQNHKNMLKRQKRRL